MESYMSNLSTELLIEIFKYLNLPELLALRLTCSRFNTIIRSGLHLFVNRQFLVTNQESEEIKAKSRKQLKTFDKLRISNNWINGRYRVTNVYINRRRFMPKLCLERNRVWSTSEKYVVCFKRQHCNKPEKIYELSAEGNADIYSFVYKDDHVISGLGDGSIWLWTPTMEQRVLHYKKCHTADINAVDLHGGIFATGCREKMCKIWSLNVEDSPTELSKLYGISLGDRIWCLKFSADGQYLFGGTAGRGCPSGTLINVERQGIVQRYDCRSYKGGGMLGAKWESPDMLWTCGYDCCLRRWDLRINECVQEWEDPYLAAVYSFDYDNSCTAITGVQLHGRTVLWDTRKKIYVQLYFTKVNSPVYDLSFDASYLYTATDYSLNVLDFTDSRAKQKNYAHNFQKVYYAVQRICRRPDTDIPYCYC